MNGTVEIPLSGADRLVQARCGMPIAEWFQRAFKDRFFVAVAAAGERVICFFEVRSALKSTKKGLIRNNELATLSQNEVSRNDVP